ncbi:TATA box-binding protein-interacting protein TIP49 [Aeropyrum pernix]|uniref:DNA helicase n=1 Tax=Aeropyrum pernix TaxID=56636 RepID=A0A401HBQ0_AERPX|nr:TATA box-binding protein-interacting protein TIP49 [Aeropyrum pernix]
MVGVSGEIRAEVVRGFGASRHSHITGLGLDADGRARKIGGGLVGQEEAREAAGVIVEMVREGRLGGRGILIVGPPGTGKTALAIAIARELGEDTPFVALNAGELFRGDSGKLEMLLQAFRKAIGVRVRERREVVEGVVTSISVSKRRTPFSPYPVIAGARITLETKDESRTFTVGPEVAEQLVALGVRRGDVIVIDLETGVVRVVGRGKGRGQGFDIDVVREVELPEGPVRKVKEFVRTLTLHDIDASIAAQRVAFTGLLSMFEAERGVTSEDRKKTDELVKKWVGEGKAEIVAGVIFIDDAHLLDMESFSFLSKAMESDLAPIIVLATNRGVAKIRGTDIESPHGIPRDLLDRLLIITTRPYTRDEIKEIIRIRADEEEVLLSENALERLADIGSEKSLRYAIQLLEPAMIVAKRRGSRRVEAEHVEEAERLFADIKRSIQLVEKYRDLMM